MGVLRTAYVNVLPKTDQFDPELKKRLRRIDARREGAQVGQTFNLGLGSSLKRVGTVGIAALGGLAAGFAGVTAGAATLGIKTAASLEQAQIGFQTLLGSGQKAKSFLANLKTFAAKTPFELPGLIDSSRLLLGVGVSADKVIPMLTAFGDAAGAVGVGQENFQRIMLATSQAISSGRFMTEDLNQITENGIPVWRLLAEATGKPVPKLRELASQGKLLAKDVLPTLQKQMEKDYGGAMAKQSQTLNGVWSTLKDTVAIGLANVLQPLVPILSAAIPRAAELAGKGLQVLKNGFHGLIEAFRGEGVTSDGFVGAMERIGLAARVAFGFFRTEVLPRLREFGGFITGTVVPALGQLIGWLIRNREVVLAFAAVFAAVRLTMFVQSIIAVVKAVRAWIAVQGGLNAVLFANPIAIVVGAIAALVVGLIYAYKHSETFRKIVDAAWRGIAAAAKWAWENVIKPVVTAFVWYYTKVVGPAVMWLWHNVIEPAWHGIARIIQAAWVVIQIIFKAWQAYFQKVLFPVIRFLWNNVVKPIFAALGTGISQAWNKRIKPVFVALGGFIRDKVAPAFRAGVAAISAAWNGIKAAAAAPVRFVIDTVINKGIIGGINWVASKVGVKDRIPPIRWSGTGAGSAVGGAAAAAARRVRGGDGPGIGDGDGDGIGSLLAGPAKWLSNRMGIGRLTSRFGANPFVHTIAGAANKAKGFALGKIQSLITELFGAGGGSVGAGGLRTGILSVLGALRGTFGSVPLISGLRRGARTLSGNVSYHASGRAIDIPAVYAWARYLAATWGSRLKELITPWREFNMLNGHPHRYSYAIEAQHGVFGHNRHIHAALDDGGTRVLRPGYNVIPNWTGRPEPIYGPVAARSMGGDIHIHLHNPVIASKRQAVDLVVEAVTTARRERRL